MPYTVPNQRVVKINREHATSNFLGIKNENWMAASRDLGAHALRLYLYLAANRDKFQLALSPAAITDEIGMPRSTYQDQFRKLLSKGYLVETSSNHYDFFEIPQPRAVTPKNKAVTNDGLNFEEMSDDTREKPSENYKKTSENVEINNKYDFIDNGEINNSDVINKNPVVNRKTLSETYGIRQQEIEKASERFDFMGRFAF